MKFSVIVPCYKQEKLVAQTLDSVLMQKSHDWELLCTDDGGPDRTGEVLDEYVKNNCRNIKEYDVQQDEDKKRVLEGNVHDFNKFSTYWGAPSLLIVKRNTLV